MPTILDKLDELMAGLGLEIPHVISVTAADRMLVVKTRGTEANGPRYSLFTYPLTTELETKNAD
jgi:hypothetical protein